MHEAARSIPGRLFCFRCTGRAECASYLQTHRYYGLLDEKAAYAAAARIYFDCRKKGNTITSAVDCLIA